MILWAAVAIVAIGYAPLAINAVWKFFDPSAPQLTVAVGSLILPHHFLHGPGSGLVHEDATYPQARWWLLVHTTLAGIGLAIGALQFSGRLRRGHPRVHRTIGATYMTLITISMVGAIGYLVITPPRAAFSGVPFDWALWGIALGVLGTIAWALLAIRRRDVRTHQRLMIMNYALLMTAPLLRIEWVLLHFLLPGADQAAVNLISALSLAPQVLTGAVVASRLGDPAGRRTPAGGPFPGRAWSAAAYGAGGLGLLWLAIRYDAVSGHVDRYLLGLLIPGALLWSFYAVAAQRSARAGATRAAREWRIHFLAITAAPASIAVFWLLAQSAYPPLVAFLAAASVGWPVAMGAGYLTVVWIERRRPARHAIRRVTDANGRVIADAL